MLENAAGKTASPATDIAGSEALPLQKIWLPKLIYDALPWFYLFSGVAALLATIYVHHWIWVVPHYLLFSVACVHLGVMVFTKRRRNSSP